MKEMGKNQQLRTGEVLIIVVVLFMWAGESGPELPFTSPGLGPGGGQKWGTLTRPFSHGNEGRGAWRQ